MNEVEKHLKKYTTKDQVLCPQAQCKAAGLVPPSVMGFKNHTATVHKIFLRAQTPPVCPAFRSSSHVSSQR